MSGSHVPKQCRSCGGFCGGGYGNKYCQNTAHLNADEKYTDLRLANLRIGGLKRELDEVLFALHMLYVETADYITINNLGDIHQNQSMRLARDALKRA